MNILKSINKYEYISNVFIEDGSNYFWEYGKCILIYIPNKFCFEATEPNSKKVDHITRTSFS